MYLSLFPHQIYSFIWLILHRWSGASKSYGLHLYRVDKLLNRYSRDVSGFLSHLLDACHPVCAIALNSAKPTYYSKCMWYPIGFWCGTHLLTVFAQFPIFLVTKRSRLSLLRVLPCDTRLPLLLDLGFWFPTCIHAQYPWTNGQRTLTKGPRCSVLATNCHCLEVISNKLVIHKILKPDMIWNSHGNV